MKWVRRAFYLAFIVFVGAGVGDIWFEEPYPAPIGPHFEHVPDSGTEWLVEHPKVFVELKNGKKKPFSFSSLGVSKSPHWVAQSVIRRKKFETPEARDWLSRRVKRAKKYRNAKTLVVQWRVKPVNKRTRKSGRPYVVEERRIQL